MKHTIGRLVASGRRALPICMLALLAAGGACKPRHKTPPPPPAAAVPDSAPVEEAGAPMPAPVPVAAAPAEDIRPTCDQYQFTDNSVGPVRIGDPRESVRARCVVMSDSIAQGGDAEGGGAGRSKIMVGVNGSPLEVEIADDRVYRLAMTDTLFRTMDGLGPGMPVSRLLDLPGALVLEGVHDLSIVVNAHCGLYFRLAKPATLPDSAAHWADIVRAMPAGTAVERVVVHGCRTGASS